MNRFFELTLSGVEHAFTLRQAEPWPGVGQAAETLNRQGFPCAEVVQVEQVHGARVLKVEDVQNFSPRPQADGLVTDRPGITLVVRVADCGPVYLVDRSGLAVGLLHSGRNGTEANILATGVGLMVREFGSKPSDILAFLGPCIRPPLYEYDIPAVLERQAGELGVEFKDSGLNTGADMRRFYSYRMEKGNTGRHFAAIRRCDL